MAASAFPLWPHQNDGLKYGLIGWYPLNEASGTVANNSANPSIAGSISNSPVWINGVVGSAISFNGSSQVVALGNNFEMTTNSGFTVSLWFKTTSPTDGVSGLLTKTRSATEYGRWGIFRDVGQVIEFLVTTPAGGGVVAATSISPFTNGIWHLAVGVIQNSGTTNIQLWIDGTNAVTTSIGALPFSYTNSDQCFIGSYADFSGQVPAYFWTGSLDDARIWNRALTATEIKQAYNFGFGTP